ncbi:hypothetical protein V5799_011261 [Amblyomma americanum]|uniref:Uncharacterized protein n=1 Tax=Amblyomma americanum TaxID=6943 RepID=A0AAQ4EHG1_AMBAM
MSLNVQGHRVKEHAPSPQYAGLLRPLTAPGNLGSLRHRKAATKGTHQRRLPHSLCSGGSIEIVSPADSRNCYRYYVVNENRNTAPSPQYAGLLRPLTGSRKPRVKLLQRTRGASNVGFYGLLAPPVLLLNRQLLAITVRAADSTPDVSCSALKPWFRLLLRVKTSNGCVAVVIPLLLQYK